MYRNCSQGRNIEAVFPRGPNLEYKSQQQARGFSLSWDIVRNISASACLNECDTLNVECDTLKVSDIYNHTQR